MTSLLSAWTHRKAVRRLVEKGVPRGRALKVVAAASKAAREGESPRGDVCERRVVKQIRSGGRKNDAAIPLIGRANRAPSATIFSDGTALVHTGRYACFGASRAAKVGLLLSRDGDLRDVVKLTAATLDRTTRSGVKLKGTQPGRAQREQQLQEALSRQGATHVALPHFRFQHASGQSPQHPSGKYSQVFDRLQPLCDRFSSWWTRDNTLRRRNLLEVQGVALGIAEIHAAGFVHHDLKPDYILIDAWAEGTLRGKVADLETATPLGFHDPDAFNLFYSPPAYAFSSPEMGGETVASDGSRDVYALAMVLFTVCRDETPANILRPTPCGTRFDYDTRQNELRAELCLVDDLKVRALIERGLFSAKRPTASEFAAEMASIAEDYL